MAFFGVYGRCVGGVGVVSGLSVKKVERVARVRVRRKRGVG